MIIAILFLLGGVACFLLMPFSPLSWLFGIILIIFGGIGFVTSFLRGLGKGVGEVLTYTECPFCAERIKRKALVCRHCGTNLSNALQSRNKTINISQDDQRNNESISPQAGTHKLTVRSFHEDRLEFLRAENFLNAVALIRHKEDVKLVRNSQSGKFIQIASEGAVRNLSEREVIELAKHYSSSAKL